MISEDKITAFLKLQQIVLNTKNSLNLLEQFLPAVLKELNLIGYPDIFLSAVFIDDSGKINRVFFADIDNKSTLAEVIKWDNVFKRGSEWEMKVMYGEAAVVSDAAFFIDSAYPQFSKILSLLMLPIQNVQKMSGVLILGSSRTADKIGTEEIEFGEMVARLINLSFRLQDTESSLTRITQQVYAMNAQLHNIDKLKDDFVSIASHELRTPMTAIRSYAWMALHRSDVPLSKTMEKYIARILLSIERLINLVNDMLNISRIESGKIEIIPEPVDLLSLVRDIIDEVYLSRAEEKKLEFVVLEKPVPKVFADPEKLRQVFLNLVGNSLKFTPSGGTITFGFFTDGKIVETSVTDTGVGISRDDMSKLFHKFSRLDNSYTAAATSGGTGLGLFISKNLVEMMHGSIRAHSEGTDRGSTFTVSLPVATADILKNAPQFTVRPAGDVKPLETAVV